MIPDHIPDHISDKIDHISDKIDLFVIGFTLAFIIFYPL